MKIKSCTPVNGKIENVRIFRPCQSLLLSIKVKDSFHTSLSETASHTTLGYVLSSIGVKLTARLISQDTGKMETFIPSVYVKELGELATFGEGHISGSPVDFVVPVLLNPTHSLNLTQNRFVEIDFTNCEHIESIDIYSVETGVISDNLFKYQKLSCPIGTARNDFKNQVSDFVLLPKDGFDYIEVTYTTGVTAILTPLELQHLNHAKNDIVLIGGVNGFMNVVQPNDAENDLSPVCDLVSGFMDSVIYIISEVVSLSIVRETDSSTPLNLIFGEQTTL